MPVRAADGEFYQCGVCLQVNIHRAAACNGAVMHSIAVIRQCNASAASACCLLCTRVVLAVRSVCLSICLQVFWPGAKYESTMDHLKQATLEDGGG